jgi:LmbE family N-acetylglucosaminyl deacetylase
MRWTRSEVDVLVPDGSSLDDALARTTHIAVGAHQDDLEFMAMHGVLACLHRSTAWFTGVTVTNGGGSSRSGPYVDFSDQQMREVRVAEQRTAARIGGYSCQIQLMVPSAELKDSSNQGPENDLRTIFEAAGADVVYLHNPADSHDTHVACCLRSIAALRGLPRERRPRRVYGCEVWRSLDWLVGDLKEVLPLDRSPNLCAALAGVFDSQIMGGKRYDLAVAGRRLANATFLESHKADRHRAVTYAMNLTPLIDDPSLDVGDFTADLVRALEEDIRTRIEDMM